MLLVIVVASGIYQMSYVANTLRQTATDDSSLIGLNRKALSYYVRIQSNTREHLKYGVHDMRIVITVDGESFVSQNIEEDLDSVAETVYDGVSGGEPLDLTLHDGSKLILGRAKVQQCLFRIVP